MSFGFAGVDVGALTVKLVVLNEAGRIQARRYAFHRGTPRPVLAELLTALDAPAAVDLAVTGSGAHLLPVQDGVVTVDTVKASTRATRALIPEAKNILDVGGASLTLVRLDDQGRFASYASNSQCAAGTGSFLDEQATRLGMGYDELASAAPVFDPPPVATRCAVFAKSDLIHLQQRGVGKPEMWSGLCRGMAQTALQTLLKGKPLGTPTALLGGVSLNRDVRYWLGELADAPILTHTDGHLFAAIGAALVGQEAARTGSTVPWREWLADLTPAPGKVSLRVVNNKAGDACELADAHERHVFGAEHAGEPLQLKRTRYPSFAVQESYTDDMDNEVRVSSWKTGGTIQASLGIDIGSTSTKLCLVDDDNRVLCDIYRKTAGEPIAATQKLFFSLVRLAATRGSRLELTACGTTGSGRKMVGAVVGADAILNEITAHVAGASQVDPEVETIFEIGGQDSKYMRVRDGAIVDANMNYACAAGTGSFVEEQARKLGIAVGDVGGMVLAVVPPPSSDRCTVFMEADVNKLLRDGRSSAEALAAVMRSVVQNYLNKVVGNRHYSRRRVTFQGATARNQGLVAAFETLLGVEMVVSPYCLVMGALGVAILARDQVRRAGRPTRFLGLDFKDRSVSLRHERCDLCENVCDVTWADVEGVDKKPSWGYMCGRDPDDEKMRVHREYDSFRKRERWLRQTGAVGTRRAHNGDKPQPRVGLPRTLTTYSHMPLWRRLLEELGAQVILGEETDRSIREAGLALTGAEFCFPIKAAHGHAAKLLERQDLDFLFLPQLVAQPKISLSAATYLCPYVQAYPPVARSALALAGKPTDKLLAPAVDRRHSESRQVRELWTVLGPTLSVTEAEVRRAWRSANQAQDELEHKCIAAGRQMLDTLAADKSHRPAIVLVGRPYNVNDPGINLDLPRKIADLGFTVLPVDFLPFAAEDIPPAFRTVFWAYGQRILSALTQIRAHDDLFPIYLTNFNCGPDSFLLSYAEEIMGEKPMLTLELDEHGADAGYMTRIEAFLDVVKAYKPTPAAAPRTIRAPQATDLKTRRIFVPPMHPISSELAAAAFRAEGMDAVAMPLETQADLDLGQRLARGSECLPLRTTIGTYINNAARDTSGKGRIFFMPGANGPCRFGQYMALHRQILDHADGKDTLLLSPSSENFYFGLSEELRRRLWHALLSGDILMKMLCRIRPYEVTQGDADRETEVWKKALSLAVEHSEDLRPTLTRASRAFSRIAMRDERRPVVGIVGEIYVRNNAFCNEELIRHIESHGGEAWLTPISEWFLYTGAEDLRRFKDLPKTFKEGLAHATRLIKSRFLLSTEASHYEAAGSILGDRHEPPITQTIEAAQPYLKFSVGGETVLTLGRAVMFARQGAALVVNASPFSCMAGTVTAALLAGVERAHGVPVVNPFYEGTGTENRRIEVFLANLDPAMALSGPPRIAPKPRRGLFRLLPRMPRMSAEN
jgi:predicted CoA-substrate-specific enzyme activase